MSPKKPPASPAAERSGLGGRGTTPAVPGELGVGLFGNKSCVKLCILPLKGEVSYCGGVVGGTGLEMRIKPSDRCAANSHKIKVKVTPIC